MNIIPLILIALGLSMDAFAVSIASGFTIRQLKLRHALLIAAFFGLFQGMMPIAGWFLGLVFPAGLSRFNHWIAFTLLILIGSKMIYESRKLKDVEEVRDPLNIFILFLLAIATSIDAFGIGLSFNLLGVAILRPALIIAVITFLVSVGGVYTGAKFGHLFEKKIELTGGIIIILIGVKILLENLLIK